ncbi:MAG: efflux RND transporter periplasmic adaptor subunit, partial [Myxococcota bacterium]
MNRLLLIPLLLGLGACASSSTPDNSTPPPPRPAKTIVVENPEASSVVRYPGRAEAVTSVDLAFRVGGPLIELPLKEGDRVEKGQIL